MGRASIMLAAEGVNVQLRSIKNHPDEAGLIGAVQLAPSWVLAGHDAILAVDIGGTNVRAGVVELNAGKGGSVEDADVWKRQHWRHADDRPVRDEAIKRIGDMIAKLIDRAADEKIKLAPFMGIGCPGLIDEHGFILKGGQNLPGNWEGKDFNLAAALSAQLPRINGHEIFILIHNDAVVQGLSEVPNMTDVSSLGRHDDRDRPGKRAVHQPRRCRRRLREPGSTSTFCPHTVGGHLVQTVEPSLAPFGRACPIRSAPRGTAWVSISPCSPPTRPRSSSACSTPAASGRSNASPARVHRRSLARLPAGRAPRHGLRISRAWPVRAGGRAPLQSEQAPARSLRQAAGRPAAMEPGAVRLPDGNRR